MAQQQDQSRFPVTRWTEVARVCQSDDEAARHQALTGICRDYWYPLYAFARRLGHGQPDAEDLTQGFFGHLLERNLLAGANREMGKLRTFLLTVFQRWIGDQEDRRRARKRGGDRIFIPLDVLAAEELYRHEPADPATPERLFERTWAMQVLRGALEMLRQAETARGRGRAFEALAPFLDPTMADSAHPVTAGQLLGLSPDATRQAVSRLRRKFRDVLRHQIAATLQDPDDRLIDEELAALREALRTG